MKVVRAGRVEPRSPSRMQREESVTVLRDSSQKNGNLEPNHEEAPDKPDLKCIPQNSWLVVFPGISVMKV